MRQVSIHERQRRSPRLQDPPQLERQQRGVFRGTPRAPGSSLGESRRDPITIPDRNITGSNGHALHIALRQLRAGALWMTQPSIPHRLPMHAAT